MKKIEKINQNELISKKHKKVCRVLNFIDYSLIVIYRITGCISISAFVSSIRFPMGIASSTLGLKFV